MAGWRSVVSGAVGHVLVMEATGIYYQGLARHAVECGISVKVVNPWQVKSFAVTRLSRTKTDRVDAGLIREFGERLAGSVPLWWPMPVALERVSGLVRFGDGLLRHGVAAGNRLHALGVVEASVVEEIGTNVKAALDQERARVMILALAEAQSDELLSGWLAGLNSLPGFGDVSSLRFMAYAGDIRRFGTARQFAAHTGLVPRFKQSGGAPEIGVMSRVGSSKLRGVLYWAAMSASLSHTPHGDFYRRLRANGKGGKVALVALANRLARAAWSVCVR